MRSRLAEKSVKLRTFRSKTCQEVRYYPQAGAYMSRDTMHYIMAPIIAMIGLQAGVLFFYYAIDEIFNPKLRTEI